MLSATSRPVIEATLPVIAERIVDITSDFYPRMFKAHPELLDGMFSRANQRSGEQAKALASSIAAFAAHLVEHPDTYPERVLARIAHKHTSLGIQPDQYQIVYENLFAAIAANLEGIINDEIAQAWTEVYWLMADALIKIEEGLYSEQANDKVWMPWRVTSKETTAPGTVTLSLEPADDTPVTPALPGQYVSVCLPTPDGLRQARQYSLLGSGAERSICVKRDQDGEISPLLHDDVEVGDVVELSNPYGELVLPEGDEPLVLATAGIGTTPTISMLQALAEQGSDRTVRVLHADGDLASWAHSDQVRDLVASLPNASLDVWFAQPEGFEPREGEAVHAGRMDLSQASIPSQARVFLCGPLSFMQGVRSQAVAAGVAPAAIDYEVFGPDVWGADAEPFAQAPSPEPVSV